MKTHKKLRIVILSLVVILLTSAFSLAILNLIALNKSKNDIKVDAFVIQPNSVLTEAQYDYYDTFYINSPEAFNVIFPEDWPYYLAQQYFGEYFKGKTIYLTDDMTITGRIHNFAGTLDGQGYSITMEDEVYESFLSSGNVYSKYGNAGLFCSQLNYGGTIRNIRFLNCKVWCQSANNMDMTYAGLIVGHNGGTVENCIVENCTFISNRQRVYCRVAPLVGKNMGTLEKGVVRNCLVTGTYTIGGNDDNGFILDNDGLQAHYFVATGFEAKNSIFNATMATTGVTNELTYPSSHDTALTSGNGNYGSATDAYNGFSSTYASKVGGPTGTVWYKYASTSKGYGKSSANCIYLRSFISWTTCTFTPGTGGSVSISSVYVPSDYSTDITTSGNTATAHGTTVTATPNSAAGYEFSHWSGSGSSRTANFKKKDIDISFADDDSSEYGNSGIGKLLYRYGSNSYTTAATVSFKVTYGSAVQINFLTSHSECIYSLSGTKYVVVKMTFTGRRIISGSPEATSRSYEVLYVLASSDYYVTSAKVTKSAEYAYTTNQSITIDRATSFTVRYAVRDYGLEIV